MFLSSLRLTTLMACLLVASATVQPSLLFSDNMVLVSSQTVKASLFGVATPGEFITLDSPDGPISPQSTTAGADGRWQLDIPPHVRVRGESSFTLTLVGSSAVDASQTKTARNVAYGDVILCSGQSNMALSLSAAYNSSEIIEAANHPEIRLFTVAKQGSMTPLPDLLNTTAFEGSPIWQPATPANVGAFSGICYLTALELQRLHHGGETSAVYGLIDSAVGSTDVQSWMAPAARTAALRTCWTPNNATVLPPSHSHAPTNATNASELWNAMIAPLVQFGVSAVLWDQGENNAQYCTASEYSCLFTSMINHWRSQFKQPTLPVAWVQIGGYAIDAYDKGGAALNSIIRFGQGDSLPIGTDQVFYNRTAGVDRFALAVSAMALSFDLGSPENATLCELEPAKAVCWWIHCRNKTEVARRLGLQLAHVWTSPGAKPLPADTEWSGPTVTETAVQIDAATNKPYAEVTFAHAGGLALQPAQGCFHCCNQTSEPPATRVVGAGEYLFEVANRRGDWLPAVGKQVDETQGTIKVVPNTNVTCTSPSQCWLAAVRYAVMDVPQCALYNSAQLPAGQFQLPVPWSRP